MEVASTPLSKNPPKLKLDEFPAELLLEIFKHAATTSKCIGITQYGLSKLSMHCLPEQASVNNLHRVCKRFHGILSNHEEFTDNGVFFRRNTFKSHYVEAPPSLPLRLINPFRYIDQMTAIEKLEIDCTFGTIEDLPWDLHYKTILVPNLRQLKIMINFPAKGIPEISLFTRTMAREMYFFRMAMIRLTRSHQVDGVEWFHVPVFRKIEWSALEVASVFENPSDRDGKVAQHVVSSLEGQWAEFLRGMMLISQESKDERGKSIDDYEEMMKFPNEDVEGEDDADDDEEDDEEEGNDEDEDDEDDDDEEEDDGDDGEEEEEVGDNEL